MKITVAFLLVAVSCCYNLASASCMRKCAKSCQKPHATDLLCLRRAMARNLLPTIDAMARLLCAYDRCKATRNKSEIIVALRYLKQVTQCGLDNILGRFTIGELNADMHNILHYLMKAVVNSLNVPNFGLLIIPPCGQLAPLLKRVTKTLLTLRTPSLDGLMLNVAGINGGKDVPGTVAVTPPGVVGQVLQMPLGPAGPARDRARSYGGLLGGIDKTVEGVGTMIGDLTGSVGGLLRGVTNTVGSVGPILRDLTGTVGELLGGATNTVGRVGPIVGDLTKSLGSVTSGLGNTVGEGGSSLLDVTGLLGTVTGAVNDVTGVMGPVTGVVSDVTGVIGPLTGVIGDVTGFLGPLTGGISKTIAGLGSSVGDITGLLPKAVSDVTGVVSNTIQTLTPVLDDVTGSVVSLSGMLGNTLEGLNDVASSAGEITEGIGRTTKKLVNNEGFEVDNLTGGLLGGFRGTNKLGYSKTGNLGNGETPFGFGGEINGRLYASGSNKVI